MNLTKIDRQILDSYAINDRRAFHVSRFRLRNQPPQFRRIMIILLLRS